MLKLYKYSWTLPKGKKRYQTTMPGESWADAKANIRRYHPKRSNIRRLK